MKTNLANRFIILFKSFAEAFILFNKKTLDCLSNMLIIKVLIILISKTIT